tara:strand:+ start:501 stop:1214 length:714 start_codon:yes stop_codon:yes gene_type:complete
MKNKNMEIWNQVSESDPKFLDKANYGRGYTTINPQSQIQKATEIFGPMGIGWGTEKEVYTESANGKMIIYTGVLWYKINDKVGAISISSDIALRDDCIKSVQTDALTKGLSRLGFNADVFFNEWDGKKYKGQSNKDRPKKAGGGMSEESYLQEQQYDGSEGVDLEKEMAYDPKTTKVKFGIADIKNKKTYDGCTKKELSDNHEHFSTYNNIDDKLRKHLNTVEAELSLRESNGVLGE